MIVYRELSSIEADLGISAQTLYSLSNNLSAHYHSVEIPKRSGGTRQLYVPDEALKKVLRAIAQKLLALEPVSVYATAYKPSSGVLSNALPHVGRARVLKLDILRFFDSIRYSTVKEKAFPKQRYSENIRILLAMLCYYKDVLPQGAPTSPAISNIILYDFDNTVGAYCRSRGISYTRYCDDMTFSGELDNVGELISFVGSELKSRGFLLNKGKTKLTGAQHRQSVTGVVVNQKPNVSDDYKREIRKQVYFLQRFGVSNHLKRIGSDRTPREYLSSLLGRISFVLQISPDNTAFKQYKAVVLTALKELESDQA